jgi:hypothetical protein
LAIHLELKAKPSFQPSSYFALLLSVDDYPSQRKSLLKCYDQRGDIYGLIEIEIGKQIGITEVRPLLSIDRDFTSATPGEKRPPFLWRCEPPRSIRQLNDATAIDIQDDQNCPSKSAIDQPCLPQIEDIAEPAAAA